MYVGVIFCLLEEKSVGGKDLLKKDKSATLLFGSKK